MSSLSSGVLSGDHSVDSLDAVKETIKDVNPETDLKLSLNSRPGSCNCSGVSCDYQDRRLKQKC